jgi:hypothetical protein
MLKPLKDGGYGKTEEELWTRYHVKIGETNNELLPAVVNNVLRQFRRGR